MTAVGILSDTYYFDGDETSWIENQMFACSTRDLVMINVCVAAPCRPVGREQGFGEQLKDLNC